MKKFTIPKAKLWRGFTLVELLVAMGIFGILAGFASINLLRAQSSATLGTMVATLVSDARLQQIKAMTGDASGTNEADAYGMYFTGDMYVLFKGTSYVAEDPTTSEIALPENVVVTTTFPNSTIIFSERSGEIANYDANTDIVTVTDGSGQQRAIEFNSLGTVSEVL